MIFCPIHLINLNIKKVKIKIYRLLEKGSHGSRFNRVFDYFIMSLILLSVGSIVLESIPGIEKKYHHWLVIFDLFSIIVFTLEYLLRLYVSDLTHPAKSRVKSALKFMFSIYGIIDLLAILPFYLPMLIKLDLRFLRILRLTRIFRILKIGRYNQSLKLIASVVKEKKEELAVTGFLAFLIMLLASFIMYYVESPHQPEAFPNILSAFWWAIATLTTVGYGDVYPITAWGKFISGVIAILGIGIVALPTGLISAGFMEKVKKKPGNTSTHCPHCGKEIKKD